VLASARQTGHVHDVPKLLFVDEFTLVAVEQQSFVRRQRKIQAHRNTLLEEVSDRFACELQD